MRIIKFFLFVLSLLIAVNSYTQQTQRYIHDVEYTFSKALDLYEKGMYGAAQRKFTKLLLSDVGNKHYTYQDDAAFYIAMCAIRLANLDSEYLVTDFIDDRPESVNKEDLTFEMANYYFRNRRYRNALEWYEKLNFALLNQQEKSEYHFKVGFSHFARRDFEKAAKNFFQIRESECMYGPMAKYFYSHIKYLNRSYQTALMGFKDLQSSPLFEQIVPYYIIQIYYFQSKYQELIEYAPPFLELTEKYGHKDIEIARMIGSALFKLEKYDEAIEFLEIYHENAPAITDYDNYELGFSFYMSGNCKKAVAYFSNIRAMRDTLSQNAAYHMADCYLKLDRKKDAKLAFETASRYDFNENIRENALLNFAKLSFELDINPFNQAINAFTKYIDEYPNSPNVDMAYNYLIDAFWSTRNYSAAINTIDRMEHRSPRLKEAYQRLAFYRGLELFKNLQFQNAINYFDKSIEHGQFNANINALSKYWKADALYRMSKYREAIPIYKEFIETRGAIVTLPEFDYAHYNLGYSFFNLKEYDKANSWFRKFEMQKRGEESIMLNDALNRTGDTYFISRNFSAAADYYKKSAVMGKIDTDYALYQMALSYGGLRRPQQQVFALSKLIREFPESEYAGSSTYKIGRAYNAELNNSDSARVYFNKLITDYPNSSMVKPALANLGSIYFNDRELDKSLKVYKQIIAQYPNTDEASNAIEMIRSIYVEMNKTEEYFDYASSELDGFEITQDEQDSLSFLAAKNLYLDENFPRALESLSNFLKRFPDSRNAVEAHYYKAELHYYFEQNEEALKSYRFVADAPRRRFTEHSTLRAAGLLYSKEEFSDAFKYYSKLAKMTENKSNSLIANIGMLRSAYYTEDYENVIESAVKLIENDRANQEQRREAYHKLAKSHQYLGNKIRALSVYETLASEVSSREGAEAKFRIAEINYQMNRDSIAEEVIYDFAKLNSPQQYWIAKSFMLLSDIFYDRGDLFSAKHTLQSIMNNYPNETDGIKDRVSEKLAKIIEEEEEVKSTNAFLDMDIDDIIIDDIDDVREEADYEIHEEIDDTQESDDMHDESHSIDRDDAGDDNIETMQENEDINIENISDTDAEEVATEEEEDTDEDNEDDEDIKEMLKEHFQEQIEQNNNIEEE